jgi:hypothetical protein
MSNTTSLKGQRPNLDGTCPNGLYLPCMYNNKLSYICDPFGDRSKKVACSRVDTIVQCPILSGGPPTYCSENVQPNIPQPPQPPQPPSPQPQPPQPQPPQPPKPQTSSELPVGMKKVNVSFMAYVLHIILIIASIIVIICYSRQIPKNKAMLSVNVCTLILQLVTVVIVLFI